MTVTGVASTNPSSQVYYNCRPEGFVIFVVGAIILSTGLLLRYYSTVGSLTTFLMSSSGAVLSFVGICLQFVQTSQKQMIPSSVSPPPMTQKVLSLPKKQSLTQKPKKSVKKAEPSKQPAPLERHIDFPLLEKAIAHFEYATTNVDEALKRVEELFATHGVQLLPFSTPFDKTPFKNLRGEKAVKMAEMLLKCGMDPLGYRLNGSFLHIFALSDECHEILNRFLERLDNANFCDKNGMTPLALACLTNGRKRLVPHKNLEADFLPTHLAAPLNALSLATHAKNKGYTIHIPDKKIEGFITSGMTPFQRLCHNIFYRKDRPFDEFEIKLLILLMNGLNLEKELKTIIVDPTKRKLFVSHLKTLPMKNLALEEWKKVIKEGSVVIDATCGNGYDTKNLADLLNGKGKLIAYDIQQEAIEKTKKLLESSLSEELQDVITYRLKSHENFEESADLFVYNLGYLPGSDKRVKTRAVGTIKSVKSALDHLNPGGLISIMCYRGHPEGVEEEEALNLFLMTIPSMKFSVRKHEWMNRQKAPSLILIWRHK